MNAGDIAAIGGAATAFGVGLIIPMLKMWADKRAAEASRGLDGSRLVLDQMALVSQQLEQAYHRIEQLEEALDDYSKRPPLDEQEN